MSTFKYTIPGNLGYKCYTLDIDTDGLKAVSNNGFIADDAAEGEPAFDDDRELDIPSGASQLIPANALEAEQAWSEGHPVYAASELDDSVAQVTSVEMLHSNNTSLYVLPQ